MNTRKTLYFTALLAGSLSYSATAQDLLIPESSNDRVMLFSAADGTLINDNFIDLTTAGVAPGTPVEAIEVAGEIWISDQIADTVFRYSADGTTFLGTTTTGRDNMRGIGAINGSVYVTNSGTSGAGYGDVLKEYATDGTLLNTHVVGDPFDVIDFNGTLLVSDIAAENIEQYAYDGTFIGTFHDSDGVTGIDFPEQLFLTSGGTVLAAGFSTPSGIYEYDASGNQINFYDPGNTGLRGIHQLDNGDLIYTTGSGVFTYNTTTGVSTQTHSGVSARFITRVGGLNSGVSYCFGDGTATPCPCGNTGPAGAGCLNSSGNGALLASSGSASVSQDNLVMSMTGGPNSTPALLFAGTNQANGGAGNPFGDGLLCVGGQIQRQQVRILNAAGEATWDPGMAALNGWNAGDTRNFQVWYRDTTVPCGAAFNLSQGIQVQFVQ